MKLAIIALFAGIFGIVIIPEINAKEVTNEEIRDAILSLVHSYNLLDNKLERHEHRERALGELVKRALQNIQKGQAVYEPMKEIFSRLDERVSQIETMLITQEERYNVQTDKLGEALEAIFKWMTHNGNHLSNQKVSKDSDEDRKNDELDELKSKVDKLTDNVKELGKTSKTLLQQTEELITSRISSADEVISKLEDKLSHFYITGPVTTAPAATVQNTEFEEKVSRYLQKISENIMALRNVPTVSEKFSEADKEFIQGLNNDTLGAIEDMRLEVLTASDKTFIKTAARIKESNEHLDGTIDEVLKTLTESVDSAEKFYLDVNKSYSILHEGLEVFNKFDKVLLSTSDYVLDTQRKVEYGVHQILVKVGDLIKSQNIDLNITLQKRFDDIDNSIINNHLEALQNLSSTMESELSQVWRQIEIMHSEMSFSKDALNKLQGQTTDYVNGTFTTMDSMEGKVSQITARMAEVDSNLNYLMGRLSLVTQEFNQIKTGLGSALDQIRSSFQTVQEKIKDVGPGPHAIPEEEYDIESNVLTRNVPMV